MPEGAQLQPATVACNEAGLRSFRSRHLVSLAANSAAGDPEWPIGSKWVLHAFIQVMFLKGFSQPRIALEVGVHRAGVAR